MTERKSLVLKTVNRIFAWFFLFLIMLSLFGIALIMFGLPGTYLFLNPAILFAASGIFSFSCAVIFAIMDLKKK